MIENHPTVPIDYIADPDALQRSHKLYALLASLVKGRGLQVIQRTPNSNGYEAMRQLIQLYHPTSRTRSLGILTALTQVHAFKTSELLLAQLFELEKMIEEYERSSNKILDDDLKTSILLKCVTGQMKNHLATVLAERATYLELREAALRYERMRRNEAQQQHAPTTEQSASAQRPGSVLLLWTGSTSTDPVTELSAIKQHKKSFFALGGRLSEIKRHRCNVSYVFYRATVLPSHLRC